MKILFDHPNPFRFAHGGFQIQIEQTKRALESIGVEVEWLRWWDTQQCGDLVHFFGRPSHWYVDAARRAGMKVVVGELLTGLGSRGSLARWLQEHATRLLRGRFFFDRMAWNVFRQADACVALTSWEAQLMRDIFGAPAEKVHVIPNGVEQEFFDSSSVDRGDWLVCTATITERKRVLELARAAVASSTPVWIIGRPYSDSDSYAKAFVEFAKRHPKIVRWEGPISNRAELAQIYRAARGFVLLSTMESLSLSALEAAACQCPLLLSDLPWARTTFGDSAAYCKRGQEVNALRCFYSSDQQRPPPPRPATWADVAVRLENLYRQLIPL
jgi:glycosyltransferase involved in cell wall biosynthesis